MAEQQRPPTVEEYARDVAQLLELEKSAEAEEATAAQQHKSLPRLEGLGVVLHRLHVAEMRTAMYGRLVVTFATRRHGTMEESPLPATKLGPGSMVDLRVVVPGGGVPQTVSSGVVTRVATARVQVAFEEAIEEDLPDGALVLAMTVNDSTQKRLRHCLTQLVEGSTACPRSALVRDILFGQTPPPELRPPSDFVPLNAGLNESQRQAIRFCLGGNTVSIIHGPPGTGKTTTVVELIAQMVQRGERVLACAPSNIAVDNIVERLARCKPRPRIVRIGHPARLLESIQAYSLDAQVAASEETALVADVRKDMDALQQRMGRCPRAARPALRQEFRSLRQELQQRERKAIEAILRAADVVLGTTTTISPLGPLRHVPPDHFSVAVVDEAGQALEVSCWVALLQAPRCVLAGDHMQLPPTVLSDEAERRGLGRTLLERATQLLGPRYVCLLNTQYRMHEAIMTWSSEQFYDGQLVADASVRAHLLTDLPGITATAETSVPVVFIDTAGCSMDETVADEETSRTTSLSKSNPGEADVVRRYVADLVAAGVRPEDIGIITPYNLQVELLRSTLQPLYGPALEIRSVDGFQGREKLVIVLSLVRSNDRNEVGFLSDFRRINVAITRAQRHLMIVGNSSTLGNDARLATLLAYLQGQGGSSEGAPVDLRSALEYMDGIIAHQPTVTPAPAAPKALTEEERKAKKEQQVAAQRERDNATRRNVLRRELQAFLASAEMRKSFPSTLNSFERRVIHELCEELGIQHTSEGTGTTRTIHVWKKEEEKEDGQGKAAAAAAAAADERIEASAFSALAVDDEEHDDDDDDDDDENDGDEDAGDDEDAGKDSPPTAVALPAGHVICKFCSKPVPEGNLEIHVLRCERLQRQAARQQEQEAAAAQAKKQVQAPQPNATGGSKRGKRAASAAGSGMSDDRLLDSLSSRANLCHFPQCKTPITVVFSDCKFCKWHFCMAHALPEAHGCGDAARRQRGAPPMAAPKPVSRTQQLQMASLQRKLQKTLEEKREERAKKPSSNDKKKKK